MATRQPARGGAPEEAIGEFMARRAREVASYGRKAEAAAYEGYKQAIRAGRDLRLSSPGEVVRHGAQLLRQKADRAAAAVSSAAQQARGQVREVVQSAGQDPVIRSKAAVAARRAGNVAGVVRGGVHAVEGLVEGANFINRLIDPLDVWKSPPGQSATAQLARGAMEGGRKAADYVQNAIADPSIIERDVRGKWGELRRDLDPSATPVASTFGGELRRNFDIGQNQGEVLFDAGSLVIGGPAAKAVKGLGRVSNIGNVDRYVAQGFGPKAAARLAEPYPESGMGSHFVPRRAKLPEFLGGGPLPRSYMDGPFNKLIPPRASIGDMYELHYGVDDRFHGTKAGGERWSGRDLGLKRYGPLGQLWHGSPAPLKARVGGLGAAAGSALYSAEDEEVR